MEKHPKTIRVYLSGVKFYFKSIGVDISFFNDPAILAICTGMDAEFGISDSAADSRTLPVTIDFILHAIKKVYSSTKPFDMCVITAFVMAFTCLFRQSEYVGKYAVLAADIGFEVIINSVVHVLSADNPRLQNVPLSLVRGVIINNKRSKMDRSGTDFHYHFQVQPLGPNVAFDVVFVLFKWALIANLKGSDIFLSYRGQWSIQIFRRL